MNIESLNRIRKIELEMALEGIENKNKKNILELGSGNGYQLNLLKKQFHNSIGIDIEESIYRHFQVEDVQSYDGTKIPFSDNSFDVIFSSNVLEHIQNLPPFQYEISRVLKKDGVVIHILPTPSWKLFTFSTHPLKILQLLFRKIFNYKITPPPPSNAKASTSQLKIYNLRMITPRRHGENGNYFTEFFYFSTYYWAHHFKNTGWRIIKIRPTHLVYSGNQIFPSLPLRIRKFLSYLLGSSTKIYYLVRKK